MDIKALMPVTPAPDRAVAALPTVQPVTPAQASSQPSTEPPLTEATISSTSTGGVFLRSTDSEGLPRWVVMTALRAYGLNLNKQLPEERQQAVQRAVAEVTQQNQQAAQTIQNAPAAVVQKAVQAAVATPTPPPAPTAKPVAKTVEHTHRGTKS